jgi:hypothetical protein
MPNPNKRRGDEAEASARNWYQLHGFPWTVRTRAGYTRDAGDLHLCPGAITQVKNCKILRWQEWFAQLAEQRSEAHADVAWLVVKRPGMGATRVGEWLAVMTVEDHAALLRAAGYGSPLEIEQPLSVVAE